MDTLSSTDFWLGAITGAFVSLIVTSAITGAWKIAAAGVREGLRRCRSFVEFRVLRRPSPIERWTRGRGLFAVGGTLSTWYVLGGTGEVGLDKSMVSARYEHEEPQDFGVFLPDHPQLRKSRQQFLSSLNVQAPETYGKKRAPYNLERFRLKRWTEQRTGPEEFPLLQFVFGPSDYANFQAVQQNLSLVHQEFLARWDPEYPDQRLAHSFGVNMCIVTADYPPIMIATARAKHTAVEPLGYLATVDEGLQKQRDLRGTTVDVFSAAAAGAKEEVGVPLSLEQIRVLSVGVDRWRYQYGLLCVAFSDLTYDQIREALSRASARDQLLEVEAVRPIPCGDPKTACAALAQVRPWHPWGLATLLQTLTNIHGAGKVESAIRATKWPKDLFTLRGCPQSMLECWARPPSAAESP